MDKCVKCGMPIDDDTRCSCEPSLCFHCCTCQPDCVCGCSAMSTNNDDSDEDDMDDDEEETDEEDDEDDDDFDDEE